MATKTKAQVSTWQAEFRIREPLLQKDVYAYERALADLNNQTRDVDLNSAVILEKFVQAFTGRGGQTASITADHTLKAAIAAAWIESPTVEYGELHPNGAKPKGKRYFVDGVDIDEMHAGKVRWYGNEVAKAYNAAVAIPDPNS